MPRVVDRVDGWLVVVNDDDVTEVHVIPQWEGVEAHPLRLNCLCLPSIDDECPGVIVHKAMTNPPRAKVTTGTS